MIKHRILSPTVVMLGMVSLFADVASEMLYPIMAIYLKSIGFSVLLIGLLEGFAEALAGLSKGYFGHFSDRLGRRMPFVRWGYFLSAVAKPMMGVWAQPLWVFAARSLDRLGKGLRTGARDALLSGEATEQTKGRVFGFHRAMDTTGAFAGPILALIYLHFYPGDYRSLFFIALVPGLLSVAATLAVKEKPAAKVERPSTRTTNFFSFLEYWRQSKPEYRKVVTGMLIFQLINSSDAFLLLKMKTAGLSDSALIGTYIFYNLVFALASYPLGALADRWGMKRVFLTGIFLFALTYAGFGINRNISIFYGLFLLYGCYAAATQGVAKAWISNCCTKEETGTAMGAYSAFQSLAALGASLIAGAIWQFLGPEVLFFSAAAGAAGTIIYFWRMKQAAPGNF